MVKEIPVIWMAGSACTGCSISLLNSGSPKFENILIEEIIPGVHINLRYHETLMAGSGDQVIQVMDEAIAEKKDAYVLVLEGAIPTANGGVCGFIGERDGKPVTMLERFTDLASNALAVLAVGTCASFGGIAAGAPNISGAMPAQKVMASKGINKPLVNIPGCPPHPDWIVNTIASVLLKGLPTAEDLDDNLRPLAFYGKLIHENCPRRAYFDEGKFAKKFGDEGCLYELGCKGPITYSDCPLRRWNRGTNWVIGAGAPCNGCTQPEFPDLVAPFYEKITDIEEPVLGEYWTAGKEAK